MSQSLDEAKLFMEEVFEPVQSGKFKGLYCNETSLEDYYDQIVTMLNTKHDEFNKAKQEAKLNKSHPVKENLSQAKENLEAILLEFKKFKYCIENNKSKQGESLIRSV